MTKEGPSGDYRLTMQRDRLGRWMPTKGERTMNIQKAREERRNFYVGGSQEHGTFSIASAKASPLRGEFLPQSTERRRGILEPPFCRRANAVFEGNRNRMARSTRFQGGDNQRFHACKRDQRETTRRIILHQRYPTDPGIDYFRGDVGEGEKAFMQGHPSVRDEPLYATPTPEGLARCT